MNARTSHGSPRPARMLWTAVLAVLFLGSSGPAAARDSPVGKESLAATASDLTFFVVSDTHYGLSPRGDETLPLLVDKMNALPGTEFPAQVGGGKVGVPRGVLHNGDITNDAKEKQWLLFVRDYGLTGKEGRLKYPVYETFGNHDGNVSGPVRLGIKERNRGRVGLAAVSENGMHYSWDWNTVHFVSLGFSPGTTAHHYDPQQSIVFLAEDLKRNVGNSGRPVILLHHFGFDPHSLGWWPEAWRKAYFDLIKGYNILAIIHGHAHESFICEWNGFDVYHPPHFRQKNAKNNIGPVLHGFFVFHIHGDVMTVAERKLDDTWGLTARKQIAKAAPPPREFVHDSQAQSGKKREKKEKPRPVAIP